MTVDALLEGLPFEDVFDVPDRRLGALAFDGDRDALYQNPPARSLLVHDWIWHRRGTGCIVSPWLLKRLNVVTR